MPTQPVHVSYCVPLQVLTKSGQRLMGPNITDVAHYLGTNMSAHPQGSYLHSQGQNHLCPERTYMTQNDSLLEFIDLVYFSLIFFYFAFLWVEWDLWVDCRTEEQFRVSRIWWTARVLTWVSATSVSLYQMGDLVSLAALNTLKFKSPTIKPKGSQNFQSKGMTLCECWLGNDALIHSKAAASFLY